MWYGVASSDSIQGIYDCVSLELLLNACNSFHATILAEMVEIDKNIFVHYIIITTTT